MPRDPRTLLADVLDAARSVERFRQGIDLDGFRANELVRAGVERKLEVVGEALNRLSRDHPNVASQIPDIARIVGFRISETSRARSRDCQLSLTSSRRTPRDALGMRERTCDFVASLAFVSMTTSGGTCGWFDAYQIAPLRLIEPGVARAGQAS